MSTEEWMGDLWTMELRNNPLPENTEDNGGQKKYRQK